MGRAITALRDLIMPKTPLVKIDELCKRFNLSELFIKDESKNPSGTYKDRRSEHIFKNAKKELVNKLCLITSGNAGYSLGKILEGSDIKLVCVIDKNLKPSIAEALRTVSSVIKTDLSARILKPEEVIALARENDEEVIWEVTNGSHEAHDSIIKELKNKPPDYIICPVGSGEAFVGLFDAIKKYDLHTKLVGVSVSANPSFADKLHTPWTPYAARIEAITNQGNRLIRLDEDEVKQSYAQANQFINCEPSAAVVFGAVSKLSFQEQDKIVLINSGKGLF